MKNLEITGKLKNIVYPTITFIALIALWEILVLQLQIPSYIVPSPSDIFKEFMNDSELLMMHSKVTLIETILGFIISVFFAIFVGTIMDFVPTLKKCFYPLMYTTQMIPTITIAPLLVIWFGFDIQSKVLLVILTCFFPILVNYTDGLDSIDIEYLNLFKVMKANKIKTFIHLKFPMSLSKIFTGLKISSTYAFIAATVAEWLGGSAGLGVYMVRAKSAYALDKVFACTILIVIFSLVFVGIINILKKIIVKENNGGLNEN